MVWPEGSGPELKLASNGVQLEPLSQGPRDVGVADPLCAQQAGVRVSGLYGGDHLARLVQGEEMGMVSSVQQKLRWV